MQSSFNSRERLMNEIQAYSFAVYDALLYLDAYPESKEALEFYNKNLRLATKAKAEYEQKYGPITMPAEGYSWQWTNGPWPWQIEGGSK
ncbi:MAG: spore coat protein CotJB [Clostridia bacterium]|nr:spore coat protein CotJB [Clostridia bacterium]